MKIPARKISSFKKHVWNFYHTHKRALPWRDHIDPYWVLISEIMLQQTQVPRGLIKFPEFISAFPTITSLAEASTADVLRVWQGLGYNRRALYLQQTAALICKHHGGVVPSDIETLKRFPGIGPNTASSIIAFAYNIPHPFIETNIRTVFLHHFFPKEDSVSDAMLLPYIKASLDTENTREWHWALMDYGTHLKKTLANPSRRSRHYTKQSAFKGSLRQLRGHILRILLKHETVSRAMIFELSPDRSVDEIEVVLGQLIGENFIEKQGEMFSIKH